MEGGYPVQLSFFIEGQRTFNTIGIANNRFHGSLSAPMIITTSCLEKLNIPKNVDKWFAMIINESACGLDRAMQNITNLGADFVFYYYKEWSDDIFSMKNKNIAIDDVTYSLVEKNNIIETGIKSNILLIKSQADMFILFITCIMLGFLLYRIFRWSYNKYETYLKNKLYSAYSGDGDEMCTICIEEIKDGEIIRTLKCKHIFHKMCIDEWFKKKEVCPNCNLTEPLLH